MARIILTDDKLSEVKSFILNNKKNKMMKISTYSTGIEGMLALENSELQDRDVMVLFFTGQSHTSLMIEKIRSFKDSHSNIAMVFVVSDCAHLSELYKLEPECMLGLSEMEEKLPEFLVNYSAKSDVARIRMMRNGKVFYIDTDRIATVYKNKRKSVIVLKDGSEFGFREKLGDVMEKLPDHFVMCHISHIVNLRLVESYGDSKVGLTEPKGYYVPVSRAKKREIKEMLKRQV